MQDWNTPDHRIAGTDHGTLHFAGDVELAIADWEITENAPDAEGRIYASIHGWLANGTGSGTLADPYAEPIEAGRARLVRTELRGQQPITDIDAHIRYHSPGQPYPNTWDHRGCLVTVSWMDRRIDRTGQIIPEDEIGRTEWTDPATGTTWDLRAAYLPKGESYHPQGFTWQHYDGWSSGVPTLLRFYADAKTPSYGGARRITDGEWVLAADAPNRQELWAAARS